MLRYNSDCNKIRRKLRNWESKFNVGVWALVGGLDFGSVEFVFFWVRHYLRSGGGGGGGDLRHFQLLQKMQVGSKRARSGKRQWTPSASALNCLLHCEAGQLFIPFKLQLRRIEFLTVHGFEVKYKTFLDYFLNGDFWISFYWRRHRTIHHHQSLLSVVKSRHVRTILYRAQS